MEVGNKVKVIGSDETGVITKIVNGKYRYWVRLDTDKEEWPFDAEELEVIK
jgi:hypothetical protein